MDSATNTQTHLVQDPLDRAAFLLGAPALGLYLFLEVKLLQAKKSGWYCFELREKLKIKEQSTLRKYLDAIHEGGLARIIFSPRGDSFLFEHYKAPASPSLEGPEISAQDRKFPFTEAEPATGEPPKISAQGGKIPLGTEKNGPETENFGSSDAKDVGGGVEFNTPTPTPLEIEELELTLKAAADLPTGPTQVKFFLGQRILDLALEYDCTISIPGHLLHGWQDAVRYDRNDLIKAVTRVKNAVLYCVQQKAVGINIKNKVGYFFDSVKRARTPSMKPDKRAILEKIKPKERTPEEIFNEKKQFWQGKTFEDLKGHYQDLKRMGLTSPEKSSWKGFIEGVELSKFKDEFSSWLAAGGE